MHEHEAPIVSISLNRDYRMNEKREELGRKRECECECCRTPGARSTGEQPVLEQVLVVAVHPGADADARLAPQLSVVHVHEHWHEAVTFVERVQVRHHTVHRRLRARDASSSQYEQSTVRTRLFSSPLLFPSLPFPVLSVELSMNV